MSDTSLKELQREYVWEAIAGAVTQFNVVGGFLARGADRKAAAAFQRGIDFIKLASPEMRALTCPSDKSPIGDLKREEAA